MWRQLAFLLTVLPFAVSAAVRPGVRRETVVGEWGEPAARIKAGQREMMIYCTEFVDMTVRDGRVASLICEPRHGGALGALAAGWHREPIPISAAALSKARGVVPAASGSQPPPRCPAIAEGVALDDVLREWGLPLWRLADAASLQLRYPKQIIEIMIEEGVVTRVEGVTRWRLHTLGSVDVSEALHWRDEAETGARLTPVVQPVEALDPYDADTPLDETEKPPAPNPTATAQAPLPKTDTLVWLVRKIAPWIVFILPWNVLTTGFLVVLLLPTKRYPTPWTDIHAGPHGTFTAVRVIIALCILGHGILLFYFLAIPIRTMLIAVG